MPTSWEKSKFPNPVKCKGTPYNTRFRPSSFLKTFVTCPNPAHCQIRQIPWNARVILQNRIPANPLPAKDCKNQKTGNGQICRILWNARVRSTKQDFSYCPSWNHLQNAHILGICKSAQSCETQGYPLQTKILANFLPENICKMPRSWKLPILPNLLKCKGTPYKTGSQPISFLKTFVKCPNPENCKMCKILWNARVPRTKEVFS